MAHWRFYTYIELTGRNPVREWIDGLPDAAAIAYIDVRLQNMMGMSAWPEKWISKYRTTKEIFEFRITHNKIQYRPLGAYFGQRKFLLLTGAIERNGKIPHSDIETAERRLALAKGDDRHVKELQFDDESDMEEDEE